MNLIKLRYDRFVVLLVVFDQNAELFIDEFLFPLFWSILGFFFFSSFVTFTQTLDESTMYLLNYLVNFVLIYCIILLLRCSCLDIMVSGLIRSSNVRSICHFPFKRNCVIFFSFQILIIFVNFCVMNF